MATGEAVLNTVRSHDYAAAFLCTIITEFAGPAWWPFMTERGQAGTKASGILGASTNARCERRTAPDLLCAGLMNQESFADKARSVANRPVSVSPVAVFLGVRKERSRTPDVCPCRACSQTRYELE